jgi:hypothetical protein
MNFEATILKLEFQSYVVSLKLDEKSVGGKPAPGHFPMPQFREGFPGPFFAVRRFSAAFVYFLGRAKESGGTAPQSKLPPSKASGRWNSQSAWRR